LITPENLHNDAPLSVHQQQMLRRARATASARCTNAQPQALHSEVANAFNHWHIQQCHKVCVGFHGKIQKKTVEDFFESDGSNVVKARPGIVPHSQLVDRPAATSNFAGPPATITATQIDNMGQKKCQDILEMLHLAKGEAQRKCDGT
jgi:hypothetical protein